MKFFETLPEITDRVKKLKEAIWAAPQAEPEVINMFTVPQYANSSFMKRRAMQMPAVLGSRPVVIREGELLFGTMLWMRPKLLKDTYEERKRYGDMSLAYSPRVMAYGTDDFIPELRRLVEEELHDELRHWSWEHSCYGLEQILHEGYAGFRDAAQDRLDEGEGTAEQRDFWESVVISCQAVIDYAARYADALEAMAEKEGDPVRRDELVRAAACVRHVPAYPARNFYEAVQSTWFSYLCHNFFMGTDLGRLDVMLRPYYEKDKAEGRVTVDEAQELLDCLWLKFMEDQVMNVKNDGMHPSIMLTGVGADGTDQTSDVTYMCLTATRHIWGSLPKVSLRVNDQTPDELYELARIMLAEGLMMPDFYNETVIIKAYERIGVPFEDAIYFAQSLCEEVSLSGISEECTNEGPHVDMNDMVMQALRACAAQESDFEELLKKTEEIIAVKIGKEMDFHNEQTQKLAYFQPEPLHSATIVGCIDSGKDILSGGAKYNNTGSLMGGIATAANSLYAIKRLVYDEKRLTLKGFVEILDADYAGHELLRAEILSKFPKYGNDDDGVDGYAVRLYDCFARELEKYTNNRGGIVKIGAWASGYRSHYPATPDGRKRWDTIATNISPTPGTDQKGATAVMRSATKLDITKCTAGGMVDITLPPACIRGEEGAQVLRQMVETYCQMGGSAIQFNFVDTKMLEAALADPVTYKNLMVRVWGYNDYYVGLPEDRQQHILDRTRHGEGL